MCTRVSLCVCARVCFSNHSHCCYTGRNFITWFNWLASNQVLSIRMFQWRALAVLLHCVCVCVSFGSNPSVLNDVIRFQWTIVIHFEVIKMYLSVHFFSLPHSPKKPIQMNTSTQADTKPKHTINIHTSNSVCTVQCTPQQASIVIVSIYVCIYFSFSFSESKFQHPTEVKRCNAIAHTQFYPHSRTHTKKRRKKYNKSKTIQTMHNGYIHTHMSLLPIGLFKWNLHSKSIRCFSFLCIMRISAFNSFHSIPFHVRIFSYFPQNVVYLRSASLFMYFQSIVIEKRRETAIVIPFFAISFEWL